MGADRGRIISTNKTTENKNKKRLETKKMTTTIMQYELSTFTGTTNYFKHWTGSLVCTDGVQYLTQAAGAYWLIDAIASYQGEPSVRAAEFQLWQLTPNNEGGATLTMCEDLGQPVIISQHIEYTDFPFDELKRSLNKSGAFVLYCIDHVLLLTSEY